MPKYRRRRRLVRIAGFRGDGLADHGRAITDAGQEIAAGVLVFCLRCVLLLQPRALEEKKRAAASGLQCEGPRVGRAAESGAQARRGNHKGEDMILRGLLSTWGAAIGASSTPTTRSRDPGSLSAFGGRTDFGSLPPPPLSLAPIE